MEDYKVIQIWPNHADHISYYNKKYLDDMFNKEAIFAQPKYDGERMVMHLNNGEVYCTSRRQSKKTGRMNEMQDSLDFSNLKIDLNYTILDGECYSEDWSHIVGILHSLPERAAELRKQTFVKYAVFDCLFYDGKDIRDLPYADRINYANQVIKQLNDERIHFVPCYHIDTVEEAFILMNDFIEQGFEGTVVKSVSRKYYDKGASLKCKKFETVDCIVYDYQQGRGKYSDTIGALKIGYYDVDADRIVHLSQVNCGSDEERNYWRDNWSALQNSVIEVKCQEITDKSLRHPVYIRRRPDKDYKMCTRDTIFK